MPVLAGSASLVGLYARYRRLVDRRYPEQALEPELITALGDGPRAKSRHVRIGELPPHLVQCVLAAEDRRFFHHPGVDLPRTLAAAARNVEAESYLQGGSTITQQ